MYGISMGANFAAETGKLLLDSGVVTQDTQVGERKDPRDIKPRMIVRLESPVSFGEDPSLLQI